MPPRTPKRTARIEGGTAVFTLPYGSRVTFIERRNTWDPEWITVGHERDLLPYRALMTAVQALPRPLQADALQDTAQAMDATLKAWTPLPTVPPPPLPPPLPRPPVPAFGNLTGYLRGTPAARQAIRTALQFWPPPPERPLLYPPLSAHSSLIGTAFTHALHALVQGINPHLHPVRGPQVAHLAALDPGLHRDRTRALLDTAEQTLAEVASGVPFDVPHARAAVILASYEVVARTGHGQHLAGAAPKEVWQDVLHLAHAVPLEHFRAERQLLLNPQFRAARRVGGTDADLMLDDLLLRVNTTRHLSLDGLDLQQLTGHLVLDRLGGTVGSAGPIGRLGVYSARYGALQVVAIRAAYRPGLLPQLVSWFDDSLPML